MQTTMGITIYGCERDEADLFREMAPRLGVVPTITEAAVSEGNIGLALGNRCISIGHTTHVTNSTLLALSEAGVMCGEVPFNDYRNSWGKLPNAADAGGPPTAG